MNSLMRKVLLASATLAPVAVVPMGSAAYAQTAVRNYSIAPQSLADALRRFGAQSGRDVVFDPALAQGKTTKGVNGALGADVALRKLLEGTGLTYVTTSEGFAIRGNAGAVAPPQSGEAQAGGATAQSESAKDETIVVTGTRLGRPSVGQQVNTYDRERIDESGQGTVAGFLSVLPEVSVSSVESGTVGTTVNLRGLPFGSTLVLVNGRRVQSASGATSAFGFFDLSLLPLALVERVDIIPNGSSAVYGGDALGGVVNIVFRRDFEGLTANLSYGGASGTNEKTASIGYGWRAGRLSGSLFASITDRSPLFGTERKVTRNATQFTFANPGNVFSLSGNLPGLPCAFAAVPQGSSGVGLTPASFSATACTQNTSALWSSFSYVPESQRAGAFATLSYQISNATEAFAEFLYSRDDTNFQGFAPIISGVVPASNPFNPFGVPVFVVLLGGDRFTGVESDRDLLRAVAGLRGELLQNWKWELSGIFSRDKGTLTDTNQIDTAALNAALAATSPAAAFNPFQDGPGGSPALLDTIYFDRVSKSEGRMASLNGFIRGQVANLLAGSVDLVLGGEFVDASLSQSRIAVLDASRKSHAFFSALRVPLLRGQRPEAAMLAGQGALRYDDYSDVGSRLTPQFGLEFRPVPSLLLRATYSEAFKPPSLNDLYAPVRSSTTTVRDPTRGNVSTPVTQISGGNPSLDPTTSTSQTLGFVYGDTPSSAFKLFVTAWRMNLDRAVALPSAQFIVNNESTYPDRVVRDPGGTIVSVNRTNLNYGRIKQSGLDAGIRSHFDTGLGLIDLNLDVTYFLKFDAAISPGAPTTSRISRADPDGVYAPRLKAIARVDWRPVDALTVNGAARYTSSYRDFDRVGSLGNIWYFDASLKWSLDRFIGRHLRDAKLSVGVVNLFNTLPERADDPFGRGFDPFNSDLVGRFGYVRLGLTL